MEGDMSILVRLIALLRGANTAQPPAATVVAALPVAKPDAENERAARAAFEVGKTAFRAKDYAAAVEYLKTVVELRHDDADAHNYLGLSYLEQGMQEDAADCFLLALHYHPQFPQALYNLALVALRRADLNEAVACLEQAIALMPDYAAAHNNLGYVLCRELGDFERGAEHIRAALRLVPDDPDALCNYSMVLIQEGRSDEALAICDQQLAANPDLHEARLNRAIAMLKLGRFAEAWPDYEARKFTHSNYVPRSLPLPEWRGQVLRDKRLLVYAEQGLGDQIMFASCLPDLLPQVGGCVIECAPRLVPIFRRSFPAARIEPQARDDASLASLVQAARFDYQVAIGSLPGYFRRNWSDFPRHSDYLHADAARVAYWKDRLGALGPGLKVGLSWFGGAASTRRDARSTQLQDWLPVLSQASCSFVSLQYGDVNGDSEMVSREHQVKIHNWSAAIDDYDETAALVTALDLVISVQTAVVHLAGALGKPAWVLVPAVPEWRYLQSGDSVPWYPSVRLFRQAEPYSWSGVFERIESALQGGLAGPSDSFSRNSR
jgi:tetratricopeptide (TPR) repeat protein